MAEAAYGGSTGYGASPYGGTARPYGNSSAIRYAGAGAGFGGGYGTGYGQSCYTARRRCLWSGEHGGCCCHRRRRFGRVQWGSRQRAPSPGGNVERGFGGRCGCAGRYRSDRVVSAADGAREVCRRWALRASSPIPYDNTLIVQSTPEQWEQIKEPAGQARRFAAAGADRREDL